MSSPRRAALVAGIFFIVAFVASVPGPFALYHGVLHDPRFITAGSGRTDVAFGALLEVITAIAVIGTAVTLFPIVRRQNEAVALGYVAGRLLEATMIVVGIISLLAVVTLGRRFSGAAGGNAASLVPLGRSLVAIHDWTFLFGPNFALGPNTLMLAHLMYRSRLVPRWIATMGLIGGPLLFLSSIAVLFGLYGQVSAWGALAALPVFLWEMSLAVRLIAKGFKESPLLSGEARCAAANQDRSLVSAPLG